MVMERCARGTLTELLRGSLAERLSRRQSLRLSCGVAAALAFLHAQDPPLIHRDLKPDNVLLDEVREITPVQPRRTPNHPFGLQTSPTAPHAQSSLLIIPLASC